VTGHDSSRESIQVRLAWSSDTTRPFAPPIVGQLPKTQPCRTHRRGRHAACREGRNGRAQTAATSASVREGGEEPSSCSLSSGEEVSYERLEVVYDHLMNAFETTATVGVRNAPSRRHIEQAHDRIGIVDSRRQGAVTGLEWPRRHLVDGLRRMASRWFMNSPTISPAPLQRAQHPVHTVDAERPSCIRIEGEPAFPNVAYQDAELIGNRQRRTSTGRGPEAGTRARPEPEPFQPLAAAMTSIDRQQSVCLDSDHALSRFRWWRIPDSRH
jgi:hypothetical protein